MEINDFRIMSPMKYYDNPEPKTTSACQKRLSIIAGDLSKNYIATRKFDGDWGCFIHYSKENNYIRSRSLSKVTGEYGNYTEKLPILTAEMDTWPDNTVLLGELCLAAPNQTANTIGTILRCLPQKAIERQKETPVEVHLFDCLMVNGKDYSTESYINRLNELKNFNSKSFFLPEVYNSCNVEGKSFAEIADSIINSGGEGLVLQLKNNPYLPGTRTAWKTLKLKQTLPHMDLKVIKTLEPTKEYNGLDEGTWQYKIDGQAVTKPYYMGWKNGVVVNFNGTEVSVTSGLTDDDREWLASNDAQEMIKRGALFAEVKAMSVNSQNSLRHPCIVRLRPDYDGAGEF